MSETLRRLSAPDESAESFQRAISADFRLRRHHIVFSWCQRTAVKLQVTAEAVFQCTDDCFNSVVVLLRPKA